jgi:hypothetical protein
MKTNKNRRETSKERQKLAKYLSKWSLKIQQLRSKMSSNPTPEDREKLVFCETEHAAALKALRGLDRPREKQRAWASGRLG